MSAYRRMGVRYLHRKYNRLTKHQFIEVILRRRQFYSPFMRFFSFCVFLLSFCCSAVYARPDSLTNPVVAKPDSLVNQVVYIPLNDSLALTDHQQYSADSIAVLYLIPNSLRRNEFIDDLYAVNIADWETLAKIGVKSKTPLLRGNPRQGRQLWVMVAMASLLIYTTLLNFFLGPDIKYVFQSVYNKHAASLSDRESSLLNSRAFIGLFLLFCFALSMVLYQLTVYYKVDYQFSGLRLFLSLSLMIGFLFAIKFLVLKIIGVLFDVNRLVSEYIAILNLTYFNVAFVLLAVALCLSLISVAYVPVVLITTIGLVAVIFAWQYLRNCVGIINNARFHKFYLFIYLCALEICPILVLIKALDI